jgi:hypothetical protein
MHVKCTEMAQNHVQKCALEFVLTHSLPNSTMVDLLIMFKIASIDLSRSKYVCAQLR